MATSQATGISNGFIISAQAPGVFYQTDPVAGTTVPQFQSYQAQFPWLYEAVDAWVTEEGTGGANGTNMVTENGDEIWW